MRPPPLPGINLIRKPTGQSDPYSKLILPIPPSSVSLGIITLHPLSLRQKRSTPDSDLEEEVQREVGERSSKRKEREGEERKRKRGKGEKGAL